MSVVFKSNRSDFQRKNNAFLDMLLANMAMDIEVGIKTTAGTPVKTGDMKAETRHFRTPTGGWPGGWRVETEKEYAAAQEKGEMTVKKDRAVTTDGGNSFFTLKAGTYKFKNYTTPGTSSGWFRRAIDGVWKNRDNYVTVAAQAVGFR